MTKSLATVCVLVAWMSTMGGVRAQILYSGGFDDNLIRAIDPADGRELEATSVFLPGKEIRGIKGLAAHPATGVLWALLQLDENMGPRELVTIELSTGRATSIGTTDSSDFRQGLAFDAAGTLYRIDDSANLVILDTADASSTLVTTITNAGIDSIAFNPLDGMMYHLSGSGGAATFESVDLGTLGLTPIPSPSISFPTALTFSPAAGEFVVAESEELNTLTPGGSDTYIADMIHESGALAFSTRSLPAVSLPALLYAAFIPFDFDVAVLWAINPANGVGRRVGPIEDATSGFERLTGMDFDPITKTLYGVGIRNSGGSTPVLMTIDHLTGAASVIGPIGIGRPRDISFRDSDGTLFAFNGDLNTIDTGTGVGALVGTVAEAGRPNGMSFSPTGALYMAQGDELHLLDPAIVTGGAVQDNLVASFTIPFLDSHGFPTLDFQPGTGTLFGVFKQTEDQADVDNYLVTVNTVSGTVTNVGQTVGDRLDSLAFYPSALSATFGDCNGDGRVDAADLVALLQNVGSSLPACDGDGDGIVEHEDIPALLPVILGGLP